MEAYLHRYSIAAKKYEEKIPLKDVINIEEMADIIEVPEGHRIVAYRNVCLSGFDFRGQRLLDHNMTIWLPSGNIYYYYNLARAKPDKSLEIVQDNSIDMLKMKQFQAFWKGGKYAKKLRKLAKRLVDWSVKKYKFERSIFYIVERFKAVPYENNCLGIAKYCTPETVLRGVFFSRHSYIFTPEDEESPSMSMVENKAQYVCCSPICHGGQIIGILYCDSPNKIEEIHNKYLVHICVQLAPTIAALIVPELKEVDLDEGN